DDFFDVAEGGAAEERLAVPLAVAADLVLTARLRPSAALCGLCRRDLPPLQEQLGVRLEGVVLVVAGAGLDAGLDVGGGAFRALGERGLELRCQLRFVF